MNIGWKLKKNGVINRFLITELTEKRYFAEPDTLPDKVNYRFINGFVDVGVLPCRVRFLQEEAKREVALPDDLRFPLMWSGGDESRSVNFSDFWPCSVHVQRFSRCVIHSDSAQAAPFTLSTCGGVTLWLNGEPITRFTPFTRNTEQTCAITLPLQAGANTLVVHSEELCERDTDYLFSLCYQGDDTLFWQLDEDAALSAQLTALDSWVNGLTLENNLIQPPVLVLNSAQPLPESVTMAHRLIGNVNESVPAWQQKQTLPAGNLGWQVDLPAVLVGYYDLVCAATCNGVTLTRTLSFGRLPSQTMPALPTLAARREAVLHHTALHGFERLGRLLAIVATGEGSEAAAPILNSALQKISRREDCADFQLVPLIWLWQRYQGQQLPPQDWRRVRSAILGFRYWIDEPGNDTMWFWSENHCLCFHVAQYLAGQNFPDDTFPCSGRRGLEQKAIAHERLTRWFDSILEHGLVEWNSAAYYPIDLIGLVALYELAQDADLREKSRVVIDRIMLMTAWVHQNGVAVGTMGRAYDKELRSGMLTELSGLCALMWGEGWLIPHCAALPLLCLSDYQPPETTDRIAHWSLPHGAEARWVQGLNRSARIIAWKQQDVAFSSVFDHHPGRPGHQQHLLDVRLGTHYAARLWVNHPGEDRPDGVHRPSYWAGNGRLPHLMQHRNRALMVFDLQQDIRPWTHLYLPQTALDDVIVEGVWCFVRGGNGYAAFHNPAGLQPFATAGQQAEGELRAYGEQNVWFVAVDSGDGDGAQGFAAFAARFRGRSLIQDSDGVRIDDPDYGELAFSHAAGFSVAQQPFIFPDDVPVVPQFNTGNP
ncbi:hypothetical protein PO856_002912 [Pectobacterium brasiliense]|uniref:hypothetical protein n=1 Tax=Pectobacterium brasiliense TaxID=180957 RepID=UPI002404F292|nr:hypothetical protein [Pectobacterium brasiliense]MDG0805659.1 hypothetical protein [Pectobacterium brasiliense]